jgi:EAL domain-containing protein (putative c-di-GMP-specific phosphodiesterase class I)
VDTFLQSSTLLEPRLAAVRLTWPQRWAQWRARHQRARRRLMHLCVPRSALLGLLAAVSFAAAQLAWNAAQTRALVHAAADRASQLVQARLESIEWQLVQASTLPAPSAQACPPELVARLLDASLASPQARQFVVNAKDGGSSCGPRGEGAAWRMAAQMPQAPALLAAPAFHAQPVLARPDREGGWALAVLGSETLALPSASEGVSEWAASALRLTLHTVDGGRLVLWGGQAAPASPGGVSSAQAAAAPAGLHATRELGRFQAHVQAQIAPGAWLRAQLGAAVLAALLGAGGVTAFALWQLRRARLRASALHRVERGLLKRQFEPYVQPIVDLRSGRCLGGEVLMRWAHPQRGVLPPSEFIEVAERSGLIAPMSELVMARAAHQLAALAAAHPWLVFSFNLTPDQLRDPGIAQLLADTFRADTLPREQVLLELTEREFVDGRVQQTLAALHQQGWQVAVDDFGTGQSSLAMLEQLPISRLKIDRAFVASIGEQTDSRPVLDAIIGLAGQLGLSMVAEGIETPAQAAYLAARGVTSAQGYLFAKPMSLPAFHRWIEAQNEQASHAPGGAGTEAGAEAAAGAGAEAAAGAPAEAAARPGPRSADGAAPLPDEGLPRLWARMQSVGGLDIRQRMWRVHSYPTCFVGSEAVDWLVKHEGLTRADALRLGQRLMALGHIRHVSDEHDFKDAHLFYQVQQTGADDMAAPPAPDLHDALRRLGDGLVMRTHGRGLLRHVRCCTGRDVVDWVVARYQVPRATAEQWGRHLMRSGRLRHVYDDRPFADGADLFRLA